MRQFRNTNHCCAPAAPRGSRRVSGVKSTGTRAEMPAAGSATVTAPE